MKKIVLKLIRWYQNHLSPDHSPRSKQHPGGFCRYQPTCSQYTYESIEKYGVVLGGMKGFWRVMRCNPWSKGGWDPSGLNNDKFPMSNDKRNPKSKIQNPNDEIR